MSAAPLPPQERKRPDGPDAPRRANGSGLDGVMPGMHEQERGIRTLLDRITAISSLLLLSPLTDEQLRYARTIESSGRALMELMNEIFDSSKRGAEAGRREKTSFSLAGLMGEAAGLVSAAAQEKGLGLRWHIAEEAPAFLSGDPEGLRKVLTHLLANAVRFTEKGEARLDARVEDEESLLLRFTVIDTGIGLEAGAGETIFNGGTGLAISRQIVRLMGGDLHAHSIPGEGATFWFTAQFQKANEAKGGSAATPMAPPPAPRARPLRILIAEDNAVNQLVLAEQIRTLGHTLMTVSNGREALTALESAGPWDAILLDCQMPVMDGYETVAAIRRREAEGARRIWAVAVTANALEGQRESCLRAGMDDFLSKPFQLRHLALALSRVPVSEERGEPVEIARLDRLAGSEAVNGQNLLERMVDLFTESGPEMLTQMENALEKGDAAGAARAAHKMAGGCLYFGAKELHSLCAEAERAGRAGDDEAARRVVPRIREEFMRVEQALRERPAGVEP